MRNMDALPKDEVLFTWMQMMSFGSNGVGFFKKRAKKECEKFLGILGFSGDSLTNEGRLIVRELANRYMEVSFDSPDYGSLVMGLKKITKKEMKLRMCHDMKVGAFDYLMIFNKEKEAREILGIFKDAYIEQVEDGRDIWEEYFSEYNL